MILDFEAESGNFIIRAPMTGKPIRGRLGVGVDETIGRLRDEYGLDFWPGASSAREAIFSTKQAYAAAPFWGFATERARADRRLAWICREIELSRTVSSASRYDETVVPPGQELSDYQRADLDYMLARKDNGGVLDADEPGLGKTPTAICFANAIKAKRVLIVCPAQIRIQWLEMWSRWTTMPGYGMVGGPIGYRVLSSSNGVNEEAAVIVISYDLAAAPGLHEALMRGRYDLLILDEAHMLKTPSTARTRAVFGGPLKRRDPYHTEGLASRCECIVALTGTPLPNRPRECHTLASHLCPESIDFMSERAFGDRFNPYEVREVHVDGQIKRYADESSGRHAELQSRLRAHFMCRHLKRDVLTQLKLPRYDLVRAEKTTAVKAALRAESLLDIDPDTLTGAHADVLGHIAEARRLMGLALAPQAARYIEYLLSTGIEKIAVFYWHIEVGDILASALSTYGVCRVDGRTTPLVKEAQKQRFRTDPKFRIIIGNVLSLGTGTDGLQDVCSDAFMAEPDWVPGNNIQCIDRLDRRGQTQAVSANFFVAPGGIAERVLAAALRKAKVTHNALDRRVA